MSEKLYTEEDLRRAFEESRLTHLVIGFKHDTFEEYQEWLGKNSEELNTKVCLHEYELYFGKTPKMDPEALICKKCGHVQYVIILYR